MQFKIAALSLFAAIAAAQNDNNTVTTDDSLAELISQLPACAKDCFNSAAKNANCAITDFQCICVDNRPKFIASIAPCVLLSGSCSDADKSAATNVATNFCHKIYTNPNDTELAEASSALTSALGSPTATQTSNNLAPTRGPALGFGLLGVAAVAAFGL